MVEPSFVCTKKMTPIKEALKMGRGGSWVGLLGSGGRFSRRTQGVWGAGPPTAGGEPDVFLP